MENSISSDLIRGHINTIILRALYDGDKYGYEICKEIEEKSQGQYELKQPTLYSSLKRLETQGYVTAYWGSVSNGGRRRYFKLTELGKQIAEQNQAEWEYSRTVIDRLISEKDYDLSSPAPVGSVDFQILKQATTKVPKLDAQQEDETEQSPAQTQSPVYYQEPDQIQRDYKDILNRLLPVENVHEESQTVSQQTFEPQPEIVSTEPFVEPVLYSESIKRDDYIEKPVQRGRFDFSDIVESAAKDGLKIRTSSAKSAFERDDEYVYGNALRCNVSFIIFAIMIVELALFGAIFRKTLSFPIATYFIIAAVMAVIPLLFTVVYFVNPTFRQRNRFQKKRSLATACIIMLNCFLAVAVFALLFNANLTGNRHLLTFIFFPLIILSNLPLSVWVYSVLLQTKRFHVKSKN